MPEDRLNEETAPPADWPRKPAIAVSSYSAASSADDQPSLHNLDFCIKSGKHVTIIDRTEAGKSSLALALLRALETDALGGGNINIDGVNIARVNLTDFRKRTILLPQEPAIFAGTIKENLDLERTRTDEQLFVK
ncbi:hypothetical protein QQX98_012095 [Neonectria punicea]|uniref:ABC transporter domain-containing protein n=1 Tax=Neonectria punicea TaxID=979145 RepID=A0ABR1GJT9_9HYPO